MFQRHDSRAHGADDKDLGPAATAEQVAAHLHSVTSPHRTFGRCFARGWSFVYNVPGRLFPFYGFSAQLWPVGRGSVESDWRFLGQVLSAVGVPRSGLLASTDVTVADPNSVLKWLWPAPAEAPVATGGSN